MEAKTRARNWISRFRHVNRPAFAVFAEQRDLSSEQHKLVSTHGIIHSEW